MISLDLLVGHNCHQFAQPWLGWSSRIRRNAAMLPVTSDAEYLANVGAKTRNMLRKCERNGYVFDEFAHNDHLDSMHSVNTSLPFRQGKMMTSSYVERPTPVATVEECLRHRRVWIGGFRDGELRAYCQLVVCGQLAIVNRIIGHGDSLKDGVMNGLVRSLVNWCDLESEALWINYLTMSGSGSLTAFKRHVGFRPMEVVCR